MARKNRQRTTVTDYDLIKTCAYWGLVISAIAALLSFIFNLLLKCGVYFNGLNSVIGIFNTIAQVAIGLAAIIAGYHYMRGRTTVWRAFYWVAVILFVLGLIGLNISGF